MIGVQDKHMKHTIFVLFVVAVISGAWQSTAHAERPDDILVVANNSLKADSVSTAELKAIYLKERTRWKTGGRAIPIHAKEGTALRRAFLQRLLRMEESRERAYWQEQKIKKGTLPPAAFSSSLRAVFQIKGSVAYVFRSDYKQGVAKVVAVLTSD